MSAGAWLRWRALGSDSLRQLLHSAPRSGFVISVYLGREKGGEGGEGGWGHVGVHVVLLRCSDSRVALTWRMAAEKLSEPSAAFRSVKFLRWLCSMFKESTLLCFQTMRLW